MTIPDDPIALARRQADALSEMAREAKAAGMDMLWFHLTMAKDEAEKVAGDRTR